MLRFLLICATLLVATMSYAQQEPIATVFGTIIDADSRQPVVLATVFLKGSNKFTETDDNGDYSLIIPADSEVTIEFSRLGFKDAKTEIKNLPQGAKRRIDVSLAPTTNDLEVVVRESRIRDGGMIREGVENLKILPTTTGNLESLLPQIALGTSGGSGGELSSQYNVRGGNYDENLVYVNDFEIYRPQLIRAGQQEGLSFANIDLISNLKFSSGGFDAKYGDKLSSVLDIRYKRPEEFRASVSGSFLGANAHIEGSQSIKGDRYRKFRYLAGARYKTTRYLLGSLDVAGEYLPDFTDIQTYLTYDLSRNWSAAFLGNFNKSVFRFQPRERSTTLGSVNQGIQLFTLFEGEERDDFTTAFAGTSLTYVPDRKKNPLYLKFLASAYQGAENERFDIIGSYSLREIETGLGSDSAGEVIGEIGNGVQQQYVRNSLQSVIANIEHKGGIEFQVEQNETTEKSHFLQWSARYQRESFLDQLNEWERLDSAGYSLPYDTNSVQIFEVLKSENQPQSSRLSGMFQHTYTWQKENVGDLRLSTGVRATYWDLNNEFILSPRIQMLYKPLGGDRDVSYRLATGMYVQPPFYRELRRPDGTLNLGLKSQKSWHAVAGFTYDFYMHGVSSKKFRLIGEAYYKRLWDVVSYEIDNVRIRYSGENDATGYVAGIDLRVNGEFVPGAESWINLSFLQAREQLTGIQHLTREFGSDEDIELDYVPRPTDQLMTLAMFFQDYLPGNENFKMHLNLTVGTGLPFGIPDNNKVYRNQFRFKAYHRVDIGFSVSLFNEEKRAKNPNHFLRFTRNSWISLEVFNMLQVQNEASQTWIKTIFQQQYAIPNYLTSRRINLRMRMDF